MAADFAALLKASALDLSIYKTLKETMDEAVKLDKDIATANLSALSNADDVKILRELHETLRTNWEKFPEKARSILEAQK
jgi:hypothetical protein